MFSIFMFVNIFQIVVPRIADPWLANFESQLLGCVQLPAQREGLEVGQTPVLAVQQDLQQRVVGDVQVPSQELVRGVQDRDRGAVRDGQDPPKELVRGVQDQRQGAVGGVRDLCQGSAQLPRDGVVRMDQDDPQFLGENLASEVQKEVKSTSRDLTLSEKILLHKDSVLLGLNFEEELAVSSLPFEVKMPEVVHIDTFAHPSEPSASTRGLSGDF